MVGLMYPKELIKPINHVNVLFLIIITFLKVNFRFQPKICNVCHNLMQNAMSFIDCSC